MNLRDFIESSLNKKIDSDSELAVCWDIAIVDSSLLLDAKTKIAYFLQYSRAATHFTSYINKVDFLGESSVESNLRLTSALFDSLICMSKISGLSNEEILLKKLFKADRKHTKSLEQVTIHEITVFIWHGIIICEVLTPWFSLQEVEKCDWQGIRDNLSILFSFLSTLCCKLDINYETLCSYYVKRNRKTENS